MPLENTQVTLFDSADAEVGTSGNPLRIDPTGTTSQPVDDDGGSLTVDGTVTSDQGSAAAVAGAWPILVTDGTDTAQVVTSTAAAAGVNGIVVYVGDVVNIAFDRPSTCVVTQSSVTTANVTLEASNASRRQLTIFNDGTMNLFVKFGAVATVADFSVRLSAKGFYEFQAPVYTGIVDAIRSAGTGNVYTSECT